MYMDDVILFGIAIVLVLAIVLVEALRTSLKKHD